MNIYRAFPTLRGSNPPNAKKRRHANLNVPSLTFKLNWKHSEGCAIDPLPNGNCCSFLGHWKPKQDLTKLRALLQENHGIHFGKNQCVGKGENTWICVEDLCYDNPDWVCITCWYTNPEFPEQVVATLREAKEVQEAKARFDLLYHQEQLKTLEKPFAGHTLQLKWITGAPTKNPFEKYDIDTEIDYDDIGSNIATKFWLLNTSTGECIGKALVSYRNVEMMKAGITIQMLEIPQELLSMGLGTYFYHEMMTACCNGLKEITRCQLVTLQATYVCSCESMGFFEHKGYEADLDEMSKTVSIVYGKEVDVFPRRNDTEGVRNGCWDDIEIGLDQNATYMGKRLFMVHDFVQNGESILEYNFKQCRYEARIPVKHAPRTIAACGDKIITNNVSPTDSYHLYVHSVKTKKEVTRRYNMKKLPFVVCRLFNIDDAHFGAFLGKSKSIGVFEVETLELVARFTPKEYNIIANRAYQYHDGLIYVLGYNKKDSTILHVEAWDYKSNATKYSVSQQFGRKVTANELPFGIFNNVVAFRNPESIFKFCLIDLTKRSAMQVIEEEFTSLDCEYESGDERSFCPPCLLTEKHLITSTAAGFEVAIYNRSTGEQVALLNECFSEVVRWDHQQDEYPECSSVLGMSLQDNNQVLYLQTFFSFVRWTFPFSL